MFAVFTVKRKKCSVLYKVVKCVAAELKVYSFNASGNHFVIKVLKKD